MKYTSKKTWEETEIQQLQNWHLSNIKRKMDRELVDPELIKDTLRYDLYEAIKVEYDERFDR